MCFLHEVLFTGSERMETVKVPCPNKENVPERCPTDDCELLAVVWQRGSSADPIVLGAVRNNGPLYFRDFETENLRSYMKWLRKSYGGYVGPDKVKDDRRRYFWQRQVVVDLTLYKPGA